MSECTLNENLKQTGAGESPSDRTQEDDHEQKTRGKGQEDAERVFTFTQLAKGDHEPTNAVQDASDDTTKALKCAFSCLIVFSVINMW